MKRLVCLTLLLLVLLSSLLCGCGNDHVYIHDRLIDYNIYTNENKTLLVFEEYGVITLWNVAVELEIGRVYHMTGSDFDQNSLGSRDNKGAITFAPHCNLERMTVDGD